MLLRSGDVELKLKLGRYVTELDETGVEFALLLDKCMPLENEAFDGVSCNSIGFSSDFADDLFSGFEVLSFSLCIRLRNRALLF